MAERDRDAFTTFYRRHLPATVGYLMRETHDPEASADLTAEVFAAIMLAARRYRPDHETALPWVIGIARNTLGASRRRGRVEDRARQRLGFEPLELDEADAQRTDWLAEQGANVRELVEALPVDERYAVLARVVRGRSYKELAEELRCSELVVRKRVSRGLERVRKQLRGA